MYDPNETYSDPSRHDRSPAAVRADNLIRQRLRIGDPRDPRAVAEGLKRRFPQEARELDLEASGLLSLPAAFFRGAGRPQAESLATSSELAQATGDVDRDLEALTTDHRLKDISIELQGWGQAIRSIVAEGTAAARLAIDPRARDRLFGSRRQLGDYARLARFVGALTPTLSPSYRKLAQSLDEVASLMLVLAGEALAGAGLGGGRFLLSVPATELQTRRDSVLQALRGLQGVTETAYSNDQWPWGLHGLREVLLRLERSGHLDLRALLDEPVLGRMLDELIERAGQQSVLGMRALGATAGVPLQRLHRLVHIIDNNVVPDSPPVTTFLKAIQLFLDAFTSSNSGYRLLFVGRAPISFYGLAGIGGPDVATNRLIQLVLRRGELAEVLDCYLGCECCGEDVTCQILLDKLLYDTDRAIDLYTLGTAPAGDGEPEFRAAAYGELIASFRNLHDTCLEDTCAPLVAGLDTTLASIQGLLLELKVPPYSLAAEMAEELCMQQLNDGRLEAVLATLAPNCLPARTALDGLAALIQDALTRLGHGTCAEVEIAPPPTTQTSLALFDRINRQFPPRDPDEDDS